MCVEAVVARGKIWIFDHITHRNTLFYIFPHYIYLHLVYFFFSKSKKKVYAWFNIFPTGYVNLVKYSSTRPSDWLTEAGGWWIVVVLWLSDSATAQKKLQLKGKKNRLNGCCPGNDLEVLNLNFYFSVGKTYCSRHDFLNTKADCRITIEYFMVFLQKSVKDSGSDQKLS